MEDAERNLDRLRGQRLPYAIFFGYFLAWLQESDTCRCLNGNGNNLTYIRRIHVYLTA